MSNYMTRNLLVVLMWAVIGLLFGGCTHGQHLTDSRVGWFNVDDSLHGFYFCTAEGDVPTCKQAQMVSADRDAQEVRKRPPQRSK